MKFKTGLLVGAAMLMTSIASAQNFSPVSVSGLVLSQGADGFMLQGPDGNYGILVTATTVTTDSWSSFVATGQGGVTPGDFVTATGFPTSQWIMQANMVVVRNAPVGGVFGTGIATGGGIIRVPTMFPPVQQGVNTFNTLPTPLNNMFSPFPIRPLR
jgi:hypothetical protein